VLRGTVVVARQSTHTSAEVEDVQDFKATQSALLDADGDPLELAAGTTAQEHARSNSV
jgi:hypothetical protein